MGARSGGARLIGLNWNALAPTTSPDPLFKTTNRRGVSCGRPMGRGAAFRFEAGDVYDVDLVDYH